MLGDIADEGKQRNAQFRLRPSRITPVLECEAAHECLSKVVVHSFTPLALPSQLRSDLLDGFPTQDRQNGGVVLDSQSRRKTWIGNGGYAGCGQHEEY